MKLDDKVLDGIALFASGYARRMMEGQLDRLMHTEAGKKLTGLSKPSKYALEAAMNGVMAFLGTKEDAIATTPFRKFLFKIVEDVPGEISTRMLAKDRPDAIDAEVVTASRKAVAESLLDLDDATLANFLNWAAGSTAEERTAALNLLGSLDAAKLAKLTSLPPEQRAAFLKLMVPESPPDPAQPSFWSRLNGSLASTNATIETRAKERAGKSS